MRILPVSIRLKEKNQFNFFCSLCSQNFCSCLFLSWTSVLAQKQKHRGHLHSTFPVIPTLANIAHMIIDCLATIFLLKLMLVCLLLSWTKDIALTHKKEKNPTNNRRTCRLQSILPAISTLPYTSPCTHTHTH